MTPVHRKTGVVRKIVINSNLKSLYFIHDIEWNREFVFYGKNPYELQFKINDAVSYDYMPGFDHVANAKRLELTCVE